MATLAFRVEADLDKVRKLRDEIARLEAELDKVSHNGTPEEIGKIEKQLSSCRAEMKDSVKSAAELGSAIADSIKKGDFSSVEAQVNALSYAISNSEQAMKQTERQINSLRTQSEQAFSAGDNEGLTAINRQLEAQVTQYKNLEEETARYRQALQSMTEGGVDTSLEGLTAVMMQITEICEQQKIEIANLQKEYQKLNAHLVLNVQQGTEEYRNGRERLTVIQGEVTARRELVNELKSCDAEIDTYAQKMREGQNATQEATDKHSSLRAQIRLLKEQMADMRANGIDEQSEAYRRLSLELGRLQDIQGDIQRQGSILANDERQFAGITSGLQGMSSGFYAVSGAMAMFGTQNQKLQGILSKTYSLMAVVNSLQQVAAMLNKDSAFRLVTLANAREWWNKLLDVGRGKQIADTAATQANTIAEQANTVAKQANTVAKQANTAAQTGNSTAVGANTAAQNAQTGSAVAGTAANITLAGAFRMVGAAIKSIPVFGWIAAGISAIVAVTAVFIKRANEAKKKAQEFYKALAEEVYKPVGAVQQLGNEWESLGDSLEAKQKFIDDNREKFDALGVTIRNLTDAETLFANNADAFIQAQMAKAKATIILQQAMDKTRDLMELEAEIDTMPDTVRRWNRPNEETNSEKERKKEQAKALKEEIEGMYKNANEYNKEYSVKLNEAGLKTSKEAVAGSANEIKKQIQKLQDEMDNDYAVGSEEYNKRKKQIEELQKQLNTDSETKGSSTKATDNSKKEAEEREKLQKQLNEQLLSIQRQNTQAEIDLMDEGTEKKLAQLDYSYGLQVDKVNEKAKELAEANANAGVTGTNDNGLTDDQQEAIKRQIELLALSYDKARKEITDAQVQAEEKAWNDFLIKYGDYLEKRQALIQKYETSISEASTKGEAETLKKEFDAALYELDNSARQSTSLIGQLFADMSQKSIRELQNLIDSAEMVMSYLDAEKDENGNAIINGNTVSQQDILDLGITPETLRQLSSSADEMESLRKAIEKVRKVLGEKSPFTQLSMDIKKAWNQIQEGDMGNGLIELANSLEGYLNEIEKFGESLGTIFGNDKISEGITNVVESFKGLGTMGKGVGSIMSGDIFGGIQTAFSGLASMVSSLGNLFSHDSDRHYERDMERLTLSNEALKESVDNLADKMSDSTTSLADALEIYTTQIANVEEQMANTQEQLQRSGSAYSNGFWGIGGHHSSNTKINDAMSASEWAKISEVAGQSVTSASDFWNLTSEQMYKVRTEASTLYAKIKDLADDGYKDAAQYMDEYTEYWKELQDITNEYYEKITNTSFDSVVSSFKSAISDMSHTAADFADDFEDMMKEAVINSLMSNKYAAQLQNWYEDFALAMENDGLDATEQEKLKQSYMDIVEDARNDIEGLYDTLGWSKSGYAQQGSAGGWESMSEDTGQELNGRFTALQETGVQLLEESRGQSEWLTRIHNINAEVQPILANSYLELQMINENTANALIFLTSIAKASKRVEQYTSKI